MEKDILKILIKHNIFDRKMHIQLANEIKELGLDSVLKMSEKFSPSQLGRMGYLGARKLAIIRRDNPETYKKIVEDLKNLRDE